MSWFASLFSLQKVETQFTLKHINQGVEGCKVGWLGWCRRSDRAPEDKQANIQTKQKKSNKHTNKKTRVAGGMTRLQQTVQLWLARALAPAAGSVKSIYWEKPPTTRAPAFGLSQVLRRGLMPAGCSSSSKLWTLPGSSLALHFFF